MNLFLDDYGWKMTYQLVCLAIILGLCLRWFIRENRSNPRESAWIEPQIWPLVQKYHTHCQGPQQDPDQSKARHQRRRSHRSSRCKQASYLYIYWTKINVRNINTLFPTQCWRFNNSGVSRWRNYLLVRLPRMQETPSPGFSVSV